MSDTHVSMDSKSKVGLDYWKVILLPPGGVTYFQFSLPEWEQMKLLKPCQQRAIHKKCLQSTVTKLRLDHLMVTNLRWVMMLFLNFHFHCIFITVKIANNSYCKRWTRNVH